MVIDDCIVGAVPEEVRNRYLDQPDDLRVELIMKGALQMIQGRKIDVAEVCSQLRIAQEARSPLGPLQTRYARAHSTASWGDQAIHCHWISALHIILSVAEPIASQTRPSSVCHTPGGC